VGIQWSKCFQLGGTLQQRILNSRMIVIQCGRLVISELSDWASHQLLDGTRLLGCSTPNKLAHFLIKSSHANIEVSRMGFSSQSYLQSEATAPTSFRISLKLRFILQIFVNMCHKFELLMWYLFRFFWQLMAIRSGPVVCMRKLPQEPHSFEITPAGKFEDCGKLWHNHLIKSIMRSTNTYYTGTLLIVVILSTWTGPGPGDLRYIPGAKPFTDRCCNLIV
jgi:hypothetical protein